MNNKIIQKKNSIISITSLLIYLLPWLLITGPFLTDLVVSLVGLIFLIYSITFKKWSYYKNIFTILFLIFYIYLVTRSLTSVFPLLSLESTLFYFRFFFFSLAVYYCSDNQKKFLQNLCFSGIAALTIVSLDAYLQIFTGVNTFMMKQHDFYRISGIFGDELIIGSYLSRLTPIFFGLYLFTKRNNPKNISLIYFFLILVTGVVYFSGERAAFFNIILFFLLLVLLGKTNKFLSLIFFFISIIFIVSSFYFKPIVKERMIDTTLDQIGIHSNKINMFSELHEAHYITAIKMFKDNPIFGQGPKLFRHLCLDDRFAYPNSCTTHPHNIYLQLLAEGGVIAFSFVFICFLLISLLFLRQFIAIYFQKYLNLKTINNSYLCILISFYISIWPIIPSNNFFNNWICTIYFLPIGILLSKIFKSERY